jgi:hypothetical protein
VSRILIAGVVGSGKSILAMREAQKLGLPNALCTDTPSQSQRRTGWQLHAPESFSGDWSALSQWIADVWLTRNGPWVIEGMAVPRALAKWRAMSGIDEMPCDKLIVLAETHLELSRRQVAMGQSALGKLNALLVDWPGLDAVTEWR